MVHKIKRVGLRSSFPLFDAILNCFVGLPRHITCIKVPKNDMTLKWSVNDMNTYMKAITYNMADKARWAENEKWLPWVKDFRLAWNIELKWWVFLIHLNRKWTTQLKNTWKLVRSTILVEISSVKERFREILACSFFVFPSFIHFKKLRDLVQLTKVKTTVLSIQNPLRSATNVHLCTID